MKILLAIDGSATTEKAVRFVGKIFGPRGGEGTSITLLHVVESLPEFLLSRAAEGEQADAYRRVWREWEETNRENAERLLEEQKQVLVAAGINESAVETRLVHREARPEATKVVAALALIGEMKSGDYDVVCLGRRGSTGAEGTFLGSVAEKILREAQGRTVWVVD